MQYRKLTKDGPDISILGYGCMRFKSKNGSVDKSLAFEQMYYAYEKGVNYYDTAYFYHGGKSETILGEFIQKYDIRDKVYIADKLPPFLVNKPSQIEKIFFTQINRLKTDYIDFYLIHMLDTFEAWEKLKDFGIIEFIEEKKKAGKIKYIGFSFHGRLEEFDKIIEDYKWDFCQIQFNYLDEYYQAGITGMKKAYDLGIGIVVMEPLRGGSLALNAPDKVKEIFALYEKQYSPAYWGLRWVMNHEEVGTVLSGMNEISHIEENVEVATRTTSNSMTENEIKIIDRVKGVYNDLMKVRCTGCNYCMPCPVGVDIPAVFSDYNSNSFFKKQRTRIAKYQYIARCAGIMGNGKSGGNICISCGKCVKLCPQNIDIPVKLQEAHEVLDNRFLRGIFTIAAKILKRNKTEIKKKLKN